MIKYFITRHLVLFLYFFQLQYFFWLLPARRRWEEMELNWNFASIQLHLFLTFQHFQLASFFSKVLWIKKLQYFIAFKVMKI